MKPDGASLRWLRPALRAFTSLRDVSLRRNLRLSLPPDRGAWLRTAGRH